MRFLPEGKHEKINGKLEDMPATHHQAILNHKAIRRLIHEGN